jgi:ribosome biogenesis GTPase
MSPLVGDRVTLDVNEDGSGYIQEILPRRNHFIRPAVANIDLMVMVAAAVNPITDPFLIDRVSALAEYHSCDFLICLNKTDLNTGDKLFSIYENTDLPIIRTSAETGEGLDVLRKALQGKVCAFTGNSGVGKSSLLNAMEPQLSLKTGEVSDKLGRGRHTTRHVELFALSEGGYIADTPGFGSFDVEQMETIRPAELQHCFPEFRPYLDDCRFNDCAHSREPGCAVLEALANGKIHPSRHASYIRLLEQAKQVKDWEIKPKQN